MSHRIGFCDDDNDVESQISAENVRVVGIRAVALRRLAEVRQRVPCSNENGTNVVLLYLEGKLQLKHLKAHPPFQDYQWRDLCFRLRNQFCKSRETSPCFPCRFKNGGSVKKSIRFWGSGLSGHIPLMRKTYLIVSLTLF